MPDLVLSILKKREAGEKITRDAFLYMDSRGKKEDFAQCGTCMMFTGDYIKKGQKDGKCIIMGDKVDIKSIGSCGLYVPGPNHVGAKTVRFVSPEESGYVERPVRCENCLYYVKDMSICKLFDKLNNSHVDFSLDPLVDPFGCCNAQSPRY